MKLGLENMRLLAERLGNPQKRLKFVHIAGTNGKGSTAAFCASVLQAAGFKTGFFTSPHLLEFGERFCINGVPMSREEMTEGLLVLRPLAEQIKSLPGGEYPTFFEIVTALALRYFERAGVDWVVWETGLGGRLDATNIVAPAVSVITSVGFDHCQYLGNTLREIAAEKAGIIKPRVPVVMAVDDAEAAEVILETARQQSAPVQRVGTEISCKNNGIVEGKQRAWISDHEYALGLWGAHQVRNAACAWGALQTLVQQGIPIPKETIRRGFQEACWPGRFERLQDQPPWVVDGAHNISAIDAVLATWQAAYGQFKYHLVFGAMSDKDIPAMAERLRVQAEIVTLLGIRNERAARPESLKPYFEELATTCYDTLADAWPQILARARHMPTLAVGSLFLAGETLAMARGVVLSETNLNELLQPKIIP